jgi:hypothetical protein
METTCLETFDEWFRFCSKIDYFSQEGCRCHFIQNFTRVFCMPVSQLSASTFWLDETTTSPRCSILVAFG